MKHKQEACVRYKESLPNQSSDTSTICRESPSQSRLEMEKSLANVRLDVLRVLRDIRQETIVRIPQIIQKRPTTGETDIEPLGRTVQVLWRRATGRVRVIY